MGAATVGHDGVACPGSAHGVQQVVMTEGNLGCPHEEGFDFSSGEVCPFCPFRKGKQGSNRKD
jgi:hypothetical protein